MGIDAIHHVSIKTYLSMYESFMFQEDIIRQNKFRKARTCVPVQLGTASLRRLTPMAAEIFHNCGNPYYPALL
jgi:hypothetical protein